jgi:hypothetical protein
MNDKFYTPLLLVLMLSPIISYSQESNIKDTVIYKVSYRDTVIYRYETVLIKQYVYSDTLKSTESIVAGSSAATKKKRKLNPTNWGIGPSAGVLYSNHGFDAYLGFGVQYYMFAVPSFRNPHMGHKKTRK